MYVISHNVEEGTYLKINNIHSPQDGFIELLNDMKLNWTYTTRDRIIIQFSSDSIEFSLLDDYLEVFNLLTQFSIVPDDIKMISLRYGLFDGSAMTYQQVSTQFDVTDECVRSRIRSAFRKIKHRFNIQRVCRLWRGEES